MIRNILFLSGAFILLAGLMTIGPMAGPPLTKCSMQRQPQYCTSGQSRPTPRCGIEITCTDKPIQLGHSEGVCFRATCPGIWAVLHKRVDQTSFRRRIWTYRHFTFKGYWELKDQGAIQSGPVEIREMFLVLPDDLIEFRLRDPDKYARVELRNLGYIKRGDLCELKKWLALQSYQQGPALIEAAMDRSRKERNDSARRSCNPNAQWPIRFGAGFFSDLSSACRRMGLPF